MDEVVIFAQYSFIQLIIFYIYDDTNEYYFTGYYGQASNQRHCWDFQFQLFVVHFFKEKISIPVRFFYIPDIRIKNFIIRSKNASARRIW